MLNFLIDMCGSCLKQDVPLFESMNEVGPNNKKVKNSTIIRNLFRTELSEEFHTCKLCEDCSILLRGAVIFENALVSSQLICSNYLKVFNAYNDRSSNQLSTLSVQIEEIRTKHEMPKEETDCAIASNDNRCANTEMQLDTETFDDDLMDTKDFKIEMDETNNEKMLNDFCCETETINEKISAKNEIVVESSPAGTMDACKVAQLSNEAQNEGSSRLPRANVGTEMDAVEDHMNDRELKAAENTQHKCDLCEKSFSSQKSYNQHKRNHTAEKAYKCDLCEKSFSIKKRYNVHRRNHTAEKAYKCDFCGKAFICKAACDVHRRIHTGEKPYKCDLCEKTFRSNSPYDLHKRMHTGKKPHKCDICEKAFYTKGDYSRHRRIHTGEKPYKCDLCGKAFSCRAYCKLHQRVHTGEKPYKCDLCEKAFKQKSAYNVHRQIHNNKKHYKCDLCEKAFSAKTNFDTHRRIHKGEKLYKCDFCEKAFCSKSNYNTHRRIHTAEKPYKCDLCKKAFYNKSNYNTHRRIHTVVKPVTQVKNIKKK